MRTSSRFPGTKRRTYLEENLGACDITLTDDDLSRLDELAPSGVAAGARYPYDWSYGDSPAAERAGSGRSPLCGPG